MGQCYEALLKRQKLGLGGWAADGKADLDSGKHPTGDYHDEREYGRYGDQKVCRRLVNYVYDEVSLFRFSCAISLCMRIFAQQDELERHEQLCHHSPERVVYRGELMRGAR